MSTKSSIHLEGDGQTNELHIYWEPGIYTSEEGIYLYAFQAGDGELLIRIKEPRKLAEALLKYIDQRTL